MGICYENKDRKTQIRQVKLKKEVKSFYLIKEVFSLLSENKKLEIIAYNKKYQDKLGITIENYKELSGKYIKGKRNGKGEEYTIDNNIKHILKIFY